MRLRHETLRGINEVNCVPKLCQPERVRTGSATIEKLHRRINKRIDAPNWERHPII